MLSCTTKNLVGCRTPRTTSCSVSFLASDPQGVVFNRTPMTGRACARQRDSSLPSDWHNDPPQDARAFQCKICCAVLCRSSSSCLTSWQLSCIFALVHAVSLSLYNSSAQSRASPAFRACRIMVLYNRIPSLSRSSSAPHWYGDLLASFSPTALLLLPRPSSLLPATCWLCTVRTSCLQILSPPRRPTIGRESSFRKNPSIWHGSLLVRLSLPASNCSNPDRGRSCTVFSWLRCQRT